jgi:hypothetical protein
MEPNLHSPSRECGCRKSRVSFVEVEAMRFTDDEGRVWTVRDVALLPERTLVEPGHPKSVERYFESANGERRLYRLAHGEIRLAGHEQLERQVREAQILAAQRQSDPNLNKV